MLRTASFCGSLLMLAACGASQGANPGGGGGPAAGSGGSAGATPAASDELCGTRPGGTLTGSHVLRFESVEPPSVVQLERSYEAAGVGHSYLFRLDGFGLRLGGETICITDPSQLEYVNTHHNWTDIARAQTDSARYELELIFDTGDTFAAFGSDGSILLPATPVIATGSPAYCWSCPTSMPVSISEVMTHNTGSLADEAGELEAWIELFNPSGGDVDLTGWSLSDDFAQRRKWVFPSITLGRHQTLVVFADNEPAQGALHAGFSLSPSGGELILTAADGTSDGGLVLGVIPEGQSLSWDWLSYVVTSTPTPGVPPPE
jgi:hypothetical protein